jgi:hypothetical protein
MTWPCHASHRPSRTVSQPWTPWWRQPLCRCVPVWLAVLPPRGVESKKAAAPDTPTPHRSAPPPPRAPALLLVGAAPLPQSPPAQLTSAGAHTPVFARAEQRADTVLPRAVSRVSVRALSAPRSGLRAAARGAELVARAIADPVVSPEAPAGRQYTLNKGKRDAKPKAAREVTVAWDTVQVGQQYKGVVVRGGPGRVHPQPRGPWLPRAPFLTRPPPLPPPVPHRHLRRVHQHRHRNRRPGPHLPALGAPTKTEPKPLCGGGCWHTSREPCLPHPTAPLKPLTRPTTDRLRE